jgi:hypothetical protein
MPRREEHEGCMEIQEIDVYIDKDGQVRLEVRGVKGESCLDVTRDVEAALGGRVEAREMTAEALESVGEHAQEQDWQWDWS